MDPLVGEESTNGWFPAILDNKGWNDPRNTILNTFGYDWNYTRPFNGTSDACFFSHPSDSNGNVHFSHVLDCPMLQFGYVSVSLNPYFQNIMTQFPSYTEIFVLLVSSIGGFFSFFWAFMEIMTLVLSECCFSHVPQEEVIYAYDMISRNKPLNNRKIKSLYTYDVFTPPLREFRHSSILGIVFSIFVPIILALYLNFETNELIASSSTPKVSFSYFTFREKFPLNVLCESDTGCVILNRAWNETSQSLYINFTVLDYNKTASLDGIFSSKIPLLYIFERKVSVFITNATSTNPMYKSLFFGNTEMNAFGFPEFEKPDMNDYNGVYIPRCRFKISSEDGVWANIDRTDSFVSKAILLQPILYKNTTITKDYTLSTYQSFRSKRGVIYQVTQNIEDILLWSPATFDPYTIPSAQIQVPNIN